MRVFADVDDRHVDWQSKAKETLERVLSTPDNTNVARNVILFLGDGMGVATVTAGRIYLAQQQGHRYGEESSLAFESFPYVGLSKVGHTQTHFHQETRGKTTLKQGAGHWPQCP